MKLVMGHHFDSAHFLPNYNGKCKHLHGHRWAVSIVVEGEVNKETGMLVDFKKLKSIVDEFDHQCLNDTLELPTAENIAIYLKSKIYEAIENKSIKVGLRLYETPDCYVEV